MGATYLDRRPRKDGKVRRMIAWKDSDGTWVRECVGTVNKTAAETALRVCENEVAAVPVGGEPYRFRRERQKSATFEAFVKNVYLPAKAPPVRRASSHERDLQVFKNVGPTFNARPLASITGTAVEEYLLARRHSVTKYGGAPSNAQLRLERQFLHAVLEMARKRRLVVENPVDGVDKIDERDDARDRALTLEEERAILAQCAPWLVEIVAFALNTAMRLSEVTSLRWDGVDRARRWIHVSSATSKTHDARSIPVNAQIDAILDGLTPVFGQEAATPHVFVNGASRAPFRASSVTHAFRRAVNKSGIARPEEVCFHSLRHSACSRLIEGGVPEVKVQALMGHRTASMTRRYSHLSPGALAGATDVLYSPVTQKGLAPSAADGKVLRLNVAGVAQ